MSLVPMLFSDWWEHLDSPHRLLGQNFGHGIHHDDVLVPHHVPEDPFITPHILEHYLRSNIKPRSTSYLRPWVQSHQKERPGTSIVKPDKDQFHVVLDIQQFTPEEINVKVVDKFIVVEGKHEEKQDEHGWISRQFTRKYLIPEQCDVEHVKSSLSSDGVLTIIAPRKHDAKQQKERSIRIEHTGRPAIFEKGDTKKEEKKVDLKEDKKPEKK